MIDTRLLLSAREAAHVCSVSISTWYCWGAAGRVPLPVRIGGRVLWRTDELRRWIDAGCPARSRFEAREEQHR